MASFAVNDPVAAANSAAANAPLSEIQVDLTKLNALSPEVISKQATVSLFASSRYPTDSQSVSSVDGAANADSDPSLRSTSVSRRVERDAEVSSLSQCKTISPRQPDD